MIQFSDYVADNATEVFIDFDLSSHPLSNRSSLTLSQTFKISELEKKLQSLGKKLADSEISEKEIAELELAMQKIVEIAVPTLPASRISELPIALKIKLIQTWQASFLA